MKDSSGDINMSTKIDIQVTSSTIKTIVYDEGTQDLFVEFNNGAKYTYYDIESEKVEELKNSESKGSYLNKEIKKNYQYKRTDQ